jgi:hypothetical protein
MMTEDEVRGIFAAKRVLVDAVERNIGEWVVWAHGAGTPVYTVADCHALAESLAASGE